MVLELERYLQRIGYLGPRRPDLETLKEVHRKHVGAISYENLDVLLGVPVDRDLERIGRKILDSGRGGWCYEMNGLLCWALEELGFSVTRMCGAVMREQMGDSTVGNHLVLSVDLGEPWIADVGLGDGLLEPIPLQEGEHPQGFRSFRLERIGDDEWRFHNRPGGLPPSFDFFHRRADEDRLTAVGRDLQTDPDSMFRQNLICQRATDDRQFLLLGRVLRELPGDRRRLLNSARELETVLEEVFRLRLPDTSELWPKVSKRHVELFGDTPVTQIVFEPPPADGPKAIIQDD